MVFDFPAKSGQRRRQGVEDERVSAIVAALKRRRGGGDELLAYKVGRRWHDLRSEDINDYVKEATGGGFSAKDFRTWNATALAAVALAVSYEATATKTARKRAVRRAIEEVSRYLGNTPAVCRASYIDPRVFDAYAAGLTIRPALERVAAGSGRASCRSISRRWRRRCSTSSRSGPTRLPWSGPPPEQQAAQRRAGRQAVHDDRDEHGGDARPDDELLLGGVQRAGADDRREVVERADAAHAEPRDERLLLRAGPSWTRRARGAWRAAGRRPGAARRRASPPSRSRRAPWR